MDIIIYLAILLECTYLVILRECRRLIHDDRDAEEIAADIQKGGVPVENMRQHIYGYLVERWDPIPDWDDPGFIQVVEAVVNPTDPKVPGFEAAKTAYDLLDSPEQGLLKLKGVERLSDEVIAQILSVPVERVRRDARLAKKTFWKLLTRERWSTLTYFLEMLCEEVDPSSSEMLKVEEEYLAAQAAHSALDQTAKDVLELRHLKGLSVSEIAAKQGALPVEISGILAEARAEFYDKFLDEIYRRTSLRINGSHDDINDTGDYHHEAYKRLCEMLYKFIPKNFRGWLQTTASSLERDSRRKEEDRGKIIEKRGGAYTNPEGEPVTVFSPHPEPLPPHEVLEQEKLEREELRRLKIAKKRWAELLTRTAQAILESKKAEKKLYILVHYILQPGLNQLWGPATARVSHEFQNPGEAMAIAHVLHHYQSKATQAEIADVIDATDRSIRRYADEILPLVKRYAKQVGIEDEELAAGCAPLKESD